MEWYWWVLIAVGVVGIGYIKLKVFKRLMDKKSMDDNE